MIKKLFVCLVIVTVVFCGDPGSQNNNRNPRYVLSANNLAAKGIIKFYGEDKSALVYRTTDINQFSTEFKPETGVGPHNGSIQDPKVTFAYESDVDYQVRSGMACQIDCLSTVSYQGNDITFFNNVNPPPRYYSYGANKDVGCFDPLNKNFNDVIVALNICININKHVIAEQFKDYDMIRLAKYIVNTQNQNQVKGRFTEPTLLAVNDQTLGQVAITDTNAAVLSSLYVASKQDPNLNVQQYVSNNNKSQKKKKRNLRNSLDGVDRNLQYLPININV
ncbi:ribosomal protein L27 [Acrasis kona]|uniref:Ribosomal protein L27 n=1 Tax=Acrasis kona TaxID=1008807 RepID=A0AAW2ZCL8_9EUKA